MDQKKLLLNERVEVRLIEEGLRGSWHLGVVIAVSNLSRTIEYDELLSERGNAKLVESVQVTEAIEGLYRRRHVSPTHRGRIRPLPPPYDFDPASCNEKLEFGFCVDAFYRDAWWEGVIFDSNVDAIERSVYFPDEGDELKLSLNHLRVSRIWDEFSGLWIDRGTWVFLELVEEFEGHKPSPGYVKLLWSSLQTNYGFQKMISEWTCGTRNLWKKYVNDVYCQIGWELRTKDLAYQGVSVRKVRNRTPKLKICQQVNLDLHRSDAFQSSNHGGHKTVTLPQTVSVINKPRDKMVSVRLRLRSLRPKQSVHPIGNDKSIFSEASSMEEHDTICKQANVISKEKDLGTTTISPGSTPKKVNNALESTEEKQIAKSKARENELQCKRIRMAYDNQLLNQQAVKYECAPQSSSNVEIDNPLGGVSLKNLKQVRRTCNLQLPELARRRISRKRCVTVGGIRKKSVARKKNTEHQADAKLRPPGRQENVNAVGAKEISFSSHRRVIPFESYGKNLRLKDMVSRSRRKKRKRVHKSGTQSDTICFVCHCGGELISCSYCFSSYHLSCLRPKEVPSEQWFCPSCCCGLCGLRDAIHGNQQFSNECFQCSRKYHIGCLNEAVQQLSVNFPEIFCSNTCHKICSDLHQLLGKSNPTCVNDLTWTLIRSKRSDCRLQGITRSGNLVKLSHALRVIQESFEPIVEVHTERNLVRDVVYSSSSKLKRLNFQGFYIMVLQKCGKVVSAATVRIHGQKVAEMPLIATNFQYRRQGMCRVLVCELVKLLGQMGIERLILPAASHLRTTWESSFGFSEMPVSDRLELLGYPLLGFHGTTMIQKLLCHSASKATNDPINCQDAENQTFFLPQDPMAGPVNQKRHYGISKQDKLQAETEEENKAKGCNGIHHPFQHVYRRKLKKETAGAEDRTRDYSKILRSFQCVYKRRRILASRD